MQQDQVHGLRRVVLQPRLLLEATRRRQPKLPVSGGGDAEQVLHKLCCTVCSHAPTCNIGFLGRCGVYACPQCLPSDIVPI